MAKSHSHAYLLLCVLEDSTPVVTFSLSQPLLQLGVASIWGESAEAFWERLTSLTRRKHLSNRLFLPEYDCEETWCLELAAIIGTPNELPRQWSRALTLWSCWTKSPGLTHLWNSCKIITCLELFQAPMSVKKKKKKFLNKVSFVVKKMLITCLIRHLMHKLLLLRNSVTFSQRHSQLIPQQVL